VSIGIEPVSYAFMRTKRNIKLLRNTRAERLSLKLRREHEQLNQPLIGIPAVLLRRYSQIASRTSELDTMARTLKETTGLTNSEDWLRWAYLVTTFRQYAVTETNLARVILRESTDRSRFDFAESASTRIDTVLGRRADVSDENVAARAVSVPSGAASEGEFNGE
jgi:hypothetical protein